MAAEVSKRPLEKGKFVWVVSRKDGKYRCIIGPDPLDASEDDMPVVADSNDPMKMIPVNSASEAIRDFITIKTGEYAVIYNPAEISQGADTAAYPNGNYTAGKNETKALQYGKKRVIISGHFPLWPNQSFEIRKIHQMASSQHIIAVVESLPLDESAPYYELTMKCAQIKEAVVDVDEAIKIEKTAVAEPAKVKDVEQSSAGQAEQKDVLPASSDEKVDGNEGAAVRSEGALSSADLRVGQKIMIPGSLEPNYIPPTGCEVIPEEVATTVVVEDPSDPTEYVEKKINDGVIKIENLSSLMEKIGLDGYFEDVRQAYSKLRDGNDGKRALSRAISRLGSARLYEGLVGVLSQNEKQTERKGDLVVRDAVILGPTECCIILDQYGKRKTYRGEGRVFPGPYDTFLTEGARGRVYDAYHLREDRKILLRVIAKQISKDELIKKLPEGSAAQLEKDSYGKGDELFIGGFDAYLFPNSAFEVINPETRNPHIGNDHSSIYVQSIGVDQKSGIYVADVSTGNVNLVKGEIKRHLDPRKERHVKRQIPKRLWNLIIGHGEPHKMTTQEMVETPWAFSVPIPNNEAALITSKDGRRVVVGPRLELLLFEEWLEVLTLSRERPKVESNLLETCFLGVTGNRITDQIEVETADFVTIKIDVCYGVEFVGTTQEEMIKWFNDRNYVMLLCNNLRSRVKLAARTKTLSELYAVIPDFVRVTILGEKPQGEGGKAGHRPGLKFDVNNMLVNEVEVLKVMIPDAEIADAIVKQNRAVITGQLALAEAKATFEATTAQEKIDQMIADIAIEKAARDRKVGLKEATSKFVVDRANAKLKHLVADLVQKNEAAIAKATEQADSDVAELARQRMIADEKAELAIDYDRRQKIVEFREALKKIQIDLIAATSKADVERLSAVQKGLIEALEGLGNKQLAETLAKHLPQATGSLGLLMGEGGLNAVLKMVKGTPMEAGINALKDSAKTLDRAADGIGKTDEETVPRDEKQTK